MRHLIVILILLILIMLIHCKEGFSSNASIFPLSNPVSEDFYKHISVPYKIPSGSEDILKDLLSDHVVVPVNPQESPLTADIDFSIVKESDIATADIPENLKFVSQMGYSEVILLATNYSRIDDLSDIVQKRCITNIGVVDLAGYNCMEHIRQSYPEMKDKLRIVQLQENELNLYGNGVESMCFVTDTDYSNPLIADVVRSQPTHFVTMHNINRGHYHITYNEQELFYKKHPFYQKHLVDMVKFRSMYPLISFNSRVTLYIPSIKVANVLLVHTDVGDSTIKHILNVLLKHNKNHLAMSNIVTNIPHHPVSNQIFRKRSRKLNR